MVLFVSDEAWSGHEEKQQQGTHAVLAHATFFCFDPIFQGSVGLLSHVLYHYIPYICLPSSCICFAVEKIYVNVFVCLHACVQRHSISRHLYATI